MAEKTTITTYDLKIILDSIFNGNLRLSQESNGGVIYSNTNSEEIDLIDQEAGTTKQVDLAEYLNIYFYNWKQRLVQISDTQIIDYDDFVQSLDLSLNQAYGLVEITDEEVVASQDIDSSTIRGRVSFLIQADKVNNLEYYTRKLRNEYLGRGETFINRYGQNIKSFILLGALIYDSEPQMTQIGEVISCSMGFTFTYLKEATSYDDYDFYLSVDGGTTYLQMPITKITAQEIFTTQAVPTASRPDLTGQLCSAVSQTITLSYFDFNTALTQALDDIFWEMSAYSIDGVQTTVKEVNVPVFLKIVRNVKTYIYKLVITNMQKTLVNTDFNVSVLGLSTYGKVE